MEIDQNSKIPKYLQIRSWLYGMIRRGKIIVGDKLPTEEELAERFAVNRMTVRQAIDELVVEKMIIRKRGEGSFLLSVKPRGYVYEVENISSFTDDMTSHGINPMTKTIKLDVIEANQKIKELLELRENNKVIFTLRVKMAEKEPVLIERSYLPYNEFKELLTMNLDNSLYHLLVEKFKIVLHHSTQIFSVEIAGDEDRKIFGLSEPIPCMKLESVTYDSDNIPIEVLHSLYRGDKYKFRATSGEYLFQK